MDRKTVDSSDLKSVGYDSKTKILEIEFHGRRIYEYYNVPETIYLRLLSASSHGKYFHNYIKNQFEFDRVL